MSAANSLQVNWPNGRVREVALDHSVIVGRENSCDLCFPEDGGLSRQHFRLAFRDGEWFVEDLESRNGTYLNGERISASRALAVGDAIKASKLIFRFSPEARESRPLRLPEDRAGEPDLQQSVVLSLKDVMQQSSPGTAPRPDVPGGQWSTPAQALLRAGRELVAGRPLPELFRVILDLSLEAVGAERGVLLTLESGKLVEQASSKGEFRISSTVRQQVLEERASLLIHDVPGDLRFQLQQSIIQQQVLSLMAVPLQTEDRVIGLIYVDCRSAQRQFTPEHLGLLTVMANVAAIRIERARLALVEQAEERHRLELEQAAAIQQRSLPDGPPDVPGYALDGRSLPCYGVGGDYYDYLWMADGRLLLVVADVAGKGLPAALLAMSLQANVHALAAATHDLATLMTRLNHALVQRCPSNRFVTCFACALDISTGVLEYCNGGHNPALVLRHSGGQEQLGAGGPPLGLLTAAEYEVDRTTLVRGDQLLLYTDGITEAEREPADFYEEERLTAVLREHAADGPTGVINAVLQSVAEWTSGGPPSDDRTLVALRRE